MHPASVEQIRRFRSLLNSALRDSAPFVASVESATTVQVERAVMFPRLWLNPSDATAHALANRLLDLASSPAGLAAVAVVDAAGHRRPVYRPLLVYALALTFTLARRTLSSPNADRWEAAVRAWADAGLRDVAMPASPFPAARGAVVAQAAWNAMSRHVAGAALGRQSWIDQSAEVFDRIVVGQQPGGAFLAAGASDNVETLAYDELVILHAVASYMACVRRETHVAAVRKAAEFHQNETQPDHGTAQPWALLAFASSPSKHLFADALLHAAAAAQHAPGLDGLSLMLLADAVYWGEVSRM